MRALVVVLLVFPALAGCVDPRLRAMQEGAARVCAEVYGDPELRRLNGLAPWRDLARETPTFEMQRIERTPRAEERAALIRWGDGRERCLRSGFASFASGAVRPIGLQFLEDTQAALADLVDGRSTFGAFNRRYAQARAQAAAKTEEARAEAAAERAEERRHDELVRELRRSRECAADPKRKGCR